MDQFPELSETFIAGEARELVELGHAVRVESAAHASNPDREARGLQAAYRSDDRGGRRLRDMTWLAARHPLRCLRDLGGRRRWRREERAPPLRQLPRRPAGSPPSGPITCTRTSRRAQRSDALRIGALLRLPYSVMTHGYDIFQLPRNLREKHERAAFAVLRLRLLGGLTCATCSGPRRAPGWSGS